MTTFMCIFYKKSNLNAHFEVDKFLEKSFVRFLQEKKIVSYFRIEKSLYTNTYTDITI